MSYKRCCNTNISIIETIINIKLLLDILERPFVGWQLLLISEEELVTSVAIKRNCIIVVSAFRRACAT